MEKQEIIDVLSELKKTYQNYESETDKKIGFCNVHNFKMEREALMYERKAYNKCISDIVILIHELYTK